ncbi:MAG: peptide-methionine (S)-S-oxide reductase MsrA [Pseudomonadota bacterium]
MRMIDTLKAAALAVTIGIGAVSGHAARAGDMEVLTVAGGCFWCVEADFEKVKGVSGAVSGFTGGTVANPTYKQVVKGGTGHFEAVEITFDPSQVSREDLMHLFLRSVDVTDDGGQFCDRGAAYRTAIFVSDAEEKALAERMIAEAQADLGQEIVTPVLDLKPFYEAEAYHQDYYKGSKLVLTRFGPKSQAEAYKAYRTACRRDATVEALWGQDAPFIGG